MESTVSATATLYTLSKTLNTPLLHRHFAKSLLRQNLLQRRFSSGLIRCITNPNFHKFTSPPAHPSPPSASFRSLYFNSPMPPRSPLISGSAAASFASSGGGDGCNGGIDGGGGGGGAGGEGFGEMKAKSVVNGSEEVNALSPDVIILDVGGMTCGGCAASVKRILENQPQVSSASVNLATETAIVWPITEAKSIQNWQQQLGEALAQHLTNCGFKSNLRGQGALEGNIQT